MLVIIFAAFVVDCCISYIERRPAGGFGWIGSNEEIDSKSGFIKIPSQNIIFHFSPPGTDTVSLLLRFTLQVAVLQKLQQTLAKLTLCQMMKKMMLTYPNQGHSFLVLLISMNGLPPHHSFQLPTTTTTKTRTITMPPVQLRTTSSLSFAHDYAQGIHSLLSQKTTAWSLSNDDNDMEERRYAAEDKEEQKLLQMEIDSMMNPQQAKPENSNSLFGGGFDAEVFDESKLPLPLFSSIVIFVVSTYLTGCMFYVGIVGFPAAENNEMVPRIF
jgi:hypothetical protein